MAYAHKIFDQNFLEYASYVIKDRAIPELKDGLKPVQRRILHSLFELDDGKFHKVANVVGHCMKYHPHGDASIYEALVSIAQKELLIDKQGNFGNIYTGDVASAARYIECRLLNFAKEILFNPDITVFTESYDGRNREPVVFPAKVPLVIILGAEGIAVGMSTKILPHNFHEVLGGVKTLLQGGTPQIFPDFNTAGILDATDYKDGMGSVRVRAKLDTSDPKRIVIREIPFGTTTEKLMNSIEAAAKKGKIKIAGINDFTSDNVEVEIRLPKGVYAADIVDALWAFTECEITHHVNLLVIHENTPVTMTVTELLKYHAGQLLQVLKKELEFEERDLKDKLHARTLEQIFIEERIYKQIETMKTQETVVTAVIEGFIPFQNQIKREVTHEDVERLLRIPIRRISLYDIEKARKEMAEIKARLKEIRTALSNLTEYAIGWLDKILGKTKGMFPRLTEVTSFQKIDVRVAAIRDKKLRYDKATGYAGITVSTGTVVSEVSDVDRILIIGKDAVYTIIDVPQKVFIGKGVLFIGIADKDILANTIFSLAYRQKSTGFVYLKRFVIEGWILGKKYPLLPDDALPMKLTLRQDLDIRLEYRQKSLLRVPEETFPLRDFLVKNPTALGKRLTQKEVMNVRFVKPGLSEEIEEESEVEEGGEP